MLNDGWIFKSQEGSHRYYIHPTKSGKVTIQFHSKELSKVVEKSVRKTLTIPAWLNKAAQEKHINFSQSFQEALLAKV